MDTIMAKVINVVDERNIVINKGFKDGVTKDNVFLIYRLGKELFDPDTKESLGMLELVCGEGKPEHIQEKITTLRTSKTEIRKTKTVKKTGPYGGLFGNTEEIYDPEIIAMPFDNVDTDCFARQIK